MNRPWLKRILYVLGGAAAALALLLAWGRRPAPVSGFYISRDFGCMCGPGVFSVADGKGYLYAPAHKTRELAGEFRAEGNGGWLKLRGVEVPVRSYNGYIEIGPTYRHMRGYRIFLPEAEAARLRAYGDGPRD